MYEDGTFTQEISDEKERAIVEVDLDRSYIIIKTKLGKRERVTLCLIYLNT